MAPHPLPFQVVVILIFSRVHVRLGMVKRLRYSTSVIRCIANARSRNHERNAEHLGFRRQKDGFDNVFYIALRCPCGAE